MLQDLWGGWETKLRLYLAADHRSYDDVHEIAREHEGMVRCVLEGDVDGFRREVGHHFPTALSGRGGPAGVGGGPVLGTDSVQSAFAADLDTTITRRSETR
jgi:hypothetical protein